MYQVLYRKWRPKKFADVVGQPQVTVTLKNELTSGRIAHAYLFTGSRGTGKTTCAKILAKAVNCLSLRDGDPCGECAICKGIDRGSVMDIVEIDAASNNGVDNIRQLREEANFTPAETKYRVYIIDEVHMLSVGAFNALLKTLEEPPEHVIFILATTEVHKLPATILSRCQRFDFRRIPPDDIARRLTFIAEQEGASLSGDAALLIARLSDGALRDALSLLDQCFGCGKDVTVETVRKTAGLAGTEYLASLAGAVLSHDPQKALEITDGLYGSSKDMARLSEEFSSYLRSLMLIKTMKNAREIITVTDDEYMLLEKQALSAPLETILHGMDTMRSALEKMHRGGNRRIEFETAVIKLCLPELDTSPQALLRRIEALEKRAAAPHFAKTPEKSAAGSAQSAIPQGNLPAGTNETVSAEGKDPSGTAAEAHGARRTPEELAAGAAKLAEWPEVVQALKSYSPSIAAAFNGSSAYVNGDYVLIDAPNELAFRLLREPRQRDNMRNAVRTVTGMETCRLGPYRPGTAQSEKDPLEKLAEDAVKEGIKVITDKSGEPPEN